MATPPEFERPIRIDRLSVPQPQEMVGIEKFWSDLYPLIESNNLQDSKLARSHLETLFDINSFRKMAESNEALQKRVEQLQSRGWDVKEGFLGTYSKNRLLDLAYGTPNQHVKISYADNTILTREGTEEVFETLEISYRDIESGQRHEVVFEPYNDGTYRLRIQKTRADNKIKMPRGSFEQIGCELEG